VQQRRDNVSDEHDVEEGTDRKARAEPSTQRPAGYRDAQMGSEEGSSLRLLPQGERALGPADLAPSPGFARIALAHSPSSVIFLSPTVRCTEKAVLLPSAGISRVLQMFDPVF
jgi:hypothetical protein